MAILMRKVRGALRKEPGRHGGAGRDPSSEAEGGRGRGASQPGTGRKSLPAEGTAYAKA